MSDFDFTTLITDRTQEDVMTLKAALDHVIDGTASEEELELVKNPFFKGAYNYTDLNRVSAAVYYLDELLRGYGYQTGVEKVVVPHKASSRLPAGYTELEYIESSGTQYIDTGFKPNQNTSVISTAELIGVSQYPHIWGARNTNTQQFRMWNDGNSVVSTAFAAGINATRYNLTAEFYGKKTFSISDGSAMVGNTKISVEMGTFQSNFNLFIFGTNNAGSLQYPAKMRLSTFALRDGSVPTRDYVPCKAPSGAVGLYDLVTAAFFANAGTGSFVAGPEVGLNDDTKDVYTWYESDIPTASLMAQYLANVLAVYSTILTEPELPEKMADLTVEGANQIEQALIDLDRIIKIMATTFIPCGEALCGGDNL